MIAVVVAVIAVSGLAVFTITQLDTENQDSMIALASSAFGIISAVVGAYLGIKITADTHATATAQAKDAAIAEHEAGVLSQKLSAVTNKVDEVIPDQAAEIKDAAKEAEEIARAKRLPPRHWEI